MPSSRPLSQDAEQELAAKIAQGLSKAMEAKEEELNRQIEHLDKLDVDDLDALRERRRKELQEAAKAKELWKQKGHGVYSEVFDEMEFFNAARQSPKVVCHFYKPDTNIERKEIMDKHLMKLCQEMLDVRFICANVERVPFITAKLNIFVLPSVILIKAQKMFHTLIGFEELGRTDNFTTKELYKVLEGHGMLEPFPPTWKPDETIE
eukprot:Blabericola_migrator_1__3811@NODE_2147_length_3206_cov_240_244982_g1359_i0_p3_GENE_NODE_2147_length_3206_cov_240_244982_g1359_i0NODE_2147_length_3206_cov_240_244982_g1359_i0_p3_ORF_typecomplete_len207_score59_22Phosducin/PF02114_16/1_2e22Thioredoxin/PF00085_20/4e03Thioredoxin/PF00085_20/0_00072BAG/PF02179_16/0_2BAG/PF02179_16/1_1e04_NODE_2147_length_3206_cov_240_244982_g1359_i014202040